MLSPNTLLQNRYLILRLLAEGGMGAVYEARDQRLGNIVALKETFFVDEDLRKAFHREASILATLRHPALPKVIDHFTEGDGQFLVMEYIRGEDLSKILQMHGRPISPSDALPWADQVLGVLEYLHSQRPTVIHRDIKPQNLKLNERGEVILLDFGLAKEAALDTSRVHRSVRGYTLNYSPLEQIQGMGTDPRSDLYSVAATFYHLMTGVAPPDAVTRATALIEGRPDPLLPAHELNHIISPVISSVLAQALAQDRNRRPSDAATLRTALRQAASVEAQPTDAAQTQPQLITPPTIPPAGEPVTQPNRALPLSQPHALDLQLSKPQRKNRSWMSIAGAAVAALAIIAAIAVWTGNRATPSSGDSAKINPDLSSNIGKAVLISSREILERGSEEVRYYSFIAQAGELKFTLDVLGNGSTVTVEALDGEKRLMSFNGNQKKISLSSSGEHEQEIARLIVDHEQSVLLQVQTSYPKGLQAFRLRIDGPASLKEAEAPTEKAPLAALFADRDRPLPLVSNTVFGGQRGRKEAYYAFTAGPGEIKFTLNVIGNGVTIAVELFNEESERLRFSSGSQKFAVSSSELNEAGSAQLVLDRQQRLLMRVHDTFPQSIQAYRLKVEGPVQFAQPDEASSATSVADALKPLFSPRDNPEPLRSREISDRIPGKESYYTFVAGPGTVNLTVEVEANGSTMVVEFFDGESRQLRFDNNSTRFSVSSTGKKEKMNAEITLAREETVLMRLSTRYIDSLKSFRLKLNGAVKKM